MSPNFFSVYLVATVAPFPTSSPLKTSPISQTATNTQSARNHGHSGYTGQATQFLTADVTAHENTITDSMATESFRSATEHQQTENGHQWSTPEQSTTEGELRKWSTDSMLMSVLLSSHTPSQSPSSPTSEDLPVQTKRSVTSLNSLDIDPEDCECKMLHDHLVASIISVAESAQLDFEDYVSILVLQYRFLQTLQTPSLICIDCPLSVDHPCCIDHFLHILTTIIWPHTMLKTLYDDHLDFIDHIVRPNFFFFLLQTSSL